MLVSSDFLGYLSRKKEIEKNSNSLVSATLKSSPGGEQKNRPVEQNQDNVNRNLETEEVEYLNERPSLFKAVL